jgi:type II pantothenate kinase
LIQKADPTPWLGADVGATLVKLVARSGDGELRFEILPSHAIDRAAREVERLRPAGLGLTGGGAPELARLLGLDTATVPEFEAWPAGAAVLLARQGETPPERDLLVSVGTGTSALLVEPGRTARVGGTALGGGTLLGLAAALLSTSRFDEVVALAAEGDRSRVDLLVGDIDPDGVIPLPRELNAASFAKLARDGAGPAARCDLAHALVGLVAENVGLVCGGIAAATAAKRIVFGGATLRDNTPLREILGPAASMLGRPVVFLADGEFAGALGALTLAAANA